MQFRDIYFVRLYKHRWNGFKVPKEKF